jgi:hypothetical protein
MFRLAGGNVSGLGMEVGDGAGRGIRLGGVRLVEGIW